MKKLKVMIIDDEILAIAHLKRLVSWERLGFDIAGEATSPARGLDMVKSLNPDLVFVDIKMPAMDGLTFIRKAKEEGATARFVVLTAYKEFDYAQQSLKLDVRDYWVKHELSSESLAQELPKLRESILKEKRARRNMRHAMLGGCLFGQPPADEDVGTLLEDLRVLGHRHFAVLLDADEPFPVTGESGIASESPGPLLTEEEEILPGWHAVDVFPLGGRQQAVLLVTRGAVSGLQMNGELFEAARLLKERYGDLCRPSTVSAAYSAEMPDIRAFGETVAQLRRLLRHRIFTGTNRIFPHDAARFHPSDEKARLAADEIPKRIRAIDDRLSAGDAEGVRGLIADLFADVKSAAHPLVLSSACRELLAALDRWRERNGLPPVRKDPGLLSGAEKHWTTVDGIAGWMAGLFEAALQGAPVERYSHHVRETIRYIRRHYAGDISIEQIAESLGISGDHLRHCFKSETGSTVLEYLTKVRIENAKAFLKDNRLKLYEVAAMVGYRNSHYFSKVFRKETGMHPLAYREGGTPS
jgi:AraC-like DNA-binding protein/DNA-binding NarL/FixJ family response regulator